MSQTTEDGGGSGSVGEFFAGIEQWRGDDVGLGDAAVEAHVRPGAIVVTGERGCRQWSREGATRGR